MKITETKLKDCFIIEPAVHGDHRGWFMETFSKQKLVEAGVKMDYEFVQDNQSYSKTVNTLRGLHFQKAPYEQTKLVRCTRGSLFDVAVDLRKDSPTYMQWFGIELSAENKKQLFIPRGFAHGFMTLEPDTEIQYKTDNYYSFECDGGIAYNDSQIGVRWPANDPVLSDKDKNLLPLSETELDF